MKLTMSQKVIWAPWRMEYILNDNKQSLKDRCLFCQIATESSDRQNLVLYRGQHAYVMMNRYPYNNGHLMVIPFDHVNDLAQLPVPVFGELMELFRRSIASLQLALRADGFNGGINLGKTAGAGIDAHLHFHIVPRWQGDYNFMPVIGETRVMPQYLMETYDNLVQYFTAERMEL